MIDPFSIVTAACLLGLVAVLLLSARWGNAPATANTLASLAVVAVPFALALTALAGVFWELIEIVARDLGEATGLEPVLVHYGLRDTAIDLAVDMLAAVVVVGIDLRLFVHLARPAPELTTVLLVGSAGALAVGSLALAVMTRVTRPPANG